ncbi:MAG TPA: hypothetical protein PLO37_21790 [Candidatus Hydrogenedentes bacterium]|nr:hypothetical protein [Candidatus Hydrogenedentota bacterium]
MARFECMRELARAHHADVIFCSIAHPSFDTLSPEERAYVSYRTRGFSDCPARTYVDVVKTINEELKRRSIEDDWGYIPVAESFRGGFEYSADVCHVHHAGIERTAEIIFQRLKERLPEALESVAAPAADSDVVSPASAM